MAAVHHVVVDSGGFIRNASLKDIGENIYTLRDVVSEIRDKATRQRLQVLPYELKLKDPSPDCIRTVTQFAKKTGDYKSLSAVDIRVLALVYQLEKEHVGTEHLKDTPDRNVSWQTAKKPLENPAEIAGFYLNQKGKQKNVDSKTSDNLENVNIVSKVSELSVNTTDTTTEETTTILHASPHGKSADTSQAVETVANTQESKNSTVTGDHRNCEDTQLTVTNEVQSQSEDDTAEGLTRDDTECIKVGDVKDRTDQFGDEIVRGIGEGEVLPLECLEEDSEGSQSEEEEEEDDGGGWITPSNIKQVKASMGDVNTKKAEVTVGCITTDFSMQNVLLQMGLNVISVDGMLIKRAKTYVLRCFACFKISSDMTRQFCFHCGNQTLKRVSMTVEEDGSIKYFLSTRKPISTRGMKYSLPAPKGGKHSSNPILVEDQKEAQQRGTKSSKVKYNVLDPDYMAHTSPFSPTDIYSRAAQLGIRGTRGRKKTHNPNENNKVYGRRK